MIIFFRLGFMPHPFQLFFFQDLIITGVPSPVSCLHRLRALALFNGSCSLTDHDVSYSVLQFTFAVSVTPHKTNTSLFPMLLSSLILSFVPFKWYEDLISFLPFCGNFLLVFIISLSVSVRNVFNGLEARTQYRYRLKCMNDFGSSAWSPVVTVSTTKKPLTSEDLQRAVTKGDVETVKNILPGKSEQWG